MKRSWRNEFLVKHKVPISCFLPRAYTVGSVLLSLAGSPSHTRTISHVEFVVMDGVMPSWPVVLLMRAKLPGLLPPKWTQRGSRRLTCTDTNTQRKALYVRSLSHVTRAAENFSEIIN